MSTIISTGPDAPGVNYPVSANAITLPLFSILFILLLIVPFRLLYRVNNIAACALVTINIISLIFVAMNALLWPTDSLASRFSGHIVCDIQVLVRQALYTAMTSTTCCISLFLARAVNTDNAFLVIYRLRRHRTNFTSTLSSSSSGLSPRRFFKLFSMSLILLIVYFPVVIYYFYLNVSWPLHAYSWSYVHDPSFWPTIFFWRIADAPKGMQYDAWNWNSLAFLIVIFWGCNSEGMEIYRRGLCKLGLARCWPRLRMSMQERRMEKMEGNSRAGMSGGSVSGSWAGKFDLITKTIHYFEDQEAKSRKQSVATTTTLGDEVMNTASRKPSHTPTYESVKSSNSGCKSLDTTSYNPSAYKTSDATTYETINEKETSISSTSATCKNSDVISPVSITPSPNNTYSHFPDHEVGKPNNQDSHTGYHPHSNSRSTIHPTPNLNPTIANQKSTHETKIWATGALKDSNKEHKESNTGLSVTGDSTKSLGDYAEDENCTRDDLLANPKPGTRVYRERERREKISEREERKKVMEKERREKDEGYEKRSRIGEGLNVERTFDIVEERSIGRACSS
ncbi:pheromone receptor 1 [Botrytis cinerea]